MKRVVKRARLIRTDKDKNGKDIPIYKLETHEITRQQVDLMTGKIPVPVVKM